MQIKKEIGISLLTDAYFASKEQTNCLFNAVIQHFGDGAIIFNEALSEFHIIILCQKVSK